MPNDLPNVTQPADLILLRLLFYFIIVMPFGKKLKYKIFFDLYMDNFTFRNSVFTLPE